MDNNKSVKLIAAAITFLLLALTGTLMAVSKLTTKLPEDSEYQWPPKDESEIYAEVLEYEPPKMVPIHSEGTDVAAEDGESSDFGASDVDSDQPTQTSYDLKNSGATEGNSTPKATQKAPSAAQQKPQTKAAGNKTPNQEDAAAAEARRQQTAKRNIDDKLNNRFSGLGKGAGANTPEGEGESTIPGNGKGKTPLGYTASVNETPKCNVQGVIVIDCIVLPDGSVQGGSAKFTTSGSRGDASIDPVMRRICEQAAYKCKFKRPKGETDNRQGRITFSWK